ncbi:unnamed protein product [Wuchereria bancrofti]|uniref:Uncharacterized protein n=1 Tax=Wuchereria bancrofti TaxID=6293 RepID=A0A3P7E8P1_WUCBA|nr:unnamed protein product [Wuchereria bancrofti]
MSAAVIPRINDDEYGTPRIKGLFTSSKLTVPRQTIARIGLQETAASICNITPYVSFE